MIIKRKKFFIIGNFQIKFVVCFVMVLALGIFLTSTLIYNLAFHILEQAAFTAHLSFDSSGEMLWEVIVKINFVVGCISVLTGVLVIAGTHLCLRKYFQSLVKGIDQLSRRNFSFRLNAKEYFFGKQFIDDFNGAAGDLQSKSDKIKAAVSEALKAINTDARESHAICQMFNRSMRAIIAGEEKSMR